MDTKQNKIREVKKERYELVVKSNTLIRNIRYELNLTEQKILIYIISKICAQDKDFKTVKFKIPEYCDVAGIRKGGRGYQLVKDSIKSIRDRSWWLEDDTQIVLFSWIDTARIEKGDGEIEIKLSESLRPYLLELSKNFTKYELINVLMLHTKYAVRCYELFKSYLYLKEWTVSLETFRDLLGVGDKYRDFTEFKRNIIDKSIKDISSNTDIKVSYKTYKKGRNIDKLVFKIEEQDYQMTLDLLEKEDRLMNKF